MKQQPVDMYKQVSDATAFVRGDGSRLHSLKALEMALYTMTDGEFTHHVNNSRNDFANWVLHVFGQKELSQKLISANSRVDMLAVLDDASRNAATANAGSFIGALQTKAATQTASVKQPVVVVPKQTAVATTSVAAKHASVAAGSQSSSQKSKSFHHKLKGMFRKGEAPVTKQNAQSYEAALQTAKAVGSASTQAQAVADSISQVHAHKRTIHDQISHLDEQLAHLTRHHMHTTAREDVGSVVSEESVKERILDFALGLIVGLMLGFILAKSLGL